MSDRPHDATSAPSDPAAPTPDATAVHERRFARRIDCTSGDLHDGEHQYSHPERRVPPARGGESPD